MLCTARSTRHAGFKRIMHTGWMPAPKISCTKGRVPEDFEARYNVKTDVSRVEIVLKKKTFSKSLLPPWLTNGLRPDMMALTMVQGCYRWGYI